VTIRFLSGSAGASVLTLALAASLAGRADTPVAATFHHVHLLSTAPPSAIEFYARVFPTTSKAAFAGIAGIRSENAYLLFERVPAAPALEPATAVWHFGWGSPTPADDVAKHAAAGIPFYAPIAKLPSGTEFAYMKGPDGAMIEINTGRARVFTHLHLFSDDPIAAGEWYAAKLGAERRGGTTRTGPGPVPFAEPTEPGPVIRSPNATMRFGDVSFIIYPRQTSAPLVSTRGHVVDHVALSVPDVAAAVARLKSDGVVIIDPLHAFGSGHAATIEGPDHIAIELID